MVHEPVIPLLALGLETLDWAKNLLLRRFLWHIATLVLLIVAAGAGASAHWGGESQHHDQADWIENLAALLAAVTELLAFRVHHLAIEYHMLGRRIMRRSMLLDAMSPNDAPEAIAYVRPHLSKRLLELAERRQVKEHERLTRYYSSTRDNKELRLRDHLYESAFFSESLYRFSARVSLLILFGFLLVALGVAAVIAVPTLFDWGHVKEHAHLPVKLFIAVLVFLPACQEFDQALLYRAGARRLGELLTRVERLWDPTIPETQLRLRLTADIGDYGADTTAVPPIRTIFWRLKDKQLGDEFNARLDKFNQAATSASGG